MKHLINEKGITLVALIITIVVLLILAAVAISSIQNENILQYATNAGAIYNNSVENEGVILNKYSDFMDKYIPESSTKLIKFTIDGVECWAEEGMKWEDWINSTYATDSGLSIRINEEGKVEKRNYFGGSYGC